MRLSAPRLEWTARKLASQDPLYLPRRLSYPVRKAAVDRMWPWLARLGRGTLPHGLRDGQQASRHFRTRPSPRWHFTPGDFDAIVAAVPHARRERTIRAAREFVGRRFAFRGAPPIHLDPVDWDAAPTPWCWTWDLNRHGWFATLGFAHAYTGESEYVDAFAQLSSSWIASNMERLGQIAWNTPFETGFRVNAWIWAYFLFRSAPEWTSSEQVRFLSALGRQAEYLHQTLEYHSPGNHVLLEAKALALCGELFPELHGARRWRAKGWRILDREIHAQICPDGVHAERSTMYHRIVAGELAELWLFARRNDLPRADMLGEVVRAMAEFQVWIDQNTNELPLMGDAHLDDTYYRFSAPVVVAAVETGRLLSEGADILDHVFWALPGTDAIQGGITRPRGARAFHAGGYFVARSAGEPGNVTVWDCGPVGYSANRKHAHLDLLSLTISVAGVPLLIDPGTTESDEAKDAFRGTRAHNTVCVDGEEQAILAARGEIWSSPIPRLLRWAASRECVVACGTHDGYRRLDNAVRHTRTLIVMHGSYWLIVDRLDGPRAQHVFEQRFHLAPGARVRHDPSSGRIDVQKGHARLALQPLRATRAGDGGVRLESGTAEMTFGRPEPIVIVSVEQRATTPCRMATLATAAAERPKLRALASPSPESTTEILEVTGPALRHHVYLRHGAPKPYDIGEGWVTDAEVAIVRHDSAGRPLDALVTGASIMRRKGRVAAAHEWTAAADVVREVSLKGVPAALR